MGKCIRKSIAKSLMKEKFTLGDLKKELEVWKDSEFILVIPLPEKKEGESNYGESGEV